MLFQHAWVMQCECLQFSLRRMIAIKQRGTVNCDLTKDRPNIRALQPAPLFSAQLITYCLAISITAPDFPKKKI